MNNSSESSDRTAREIGLFAIGFLGFGTAGAGIVLGSAPVALAGAVALLLAVNGLRSFSTD